MKINLRSRREIPYRQRRSGYATRRKSTRLTYLVHCRDFKVGCYQLFNMLDTEVTDANAANLSFLFGFNDSSPTSGTSLGASTRAVYEIQVDIAQLALFERLFDSMLSCCCSADVVMQFRCVEYFGSFHLMFLTEV